ncbi:MAG: DNA mismatch repair endonuclease MutL [Oscillospiraceae bacterium]|nr:DNA mismatch repair endonuclease MutL [Oscillospiraceae bacterium]
MAQINLLSKDISELIAAGEVIERPASVIKELLENSIDAGAKHVTVEIKNGGTTYMRITDDGCGIASEQVATAFMRHATSKIASKDDLDNILTLGFRGEALASVCAVAKVEVLTKQKDDEYGTNYVIEGGTEKLNETTGCPDGTTIIIRDIFFNVPVRQKFMKRDSAEANAIISIMQKIVLSHPDISFRLIKDNKTMFASAGDGQLLSAVYGIYGRDFAHDLIPVDYSENGISVKGYVIKPLYSKNNRSFQNFFINGRYVKSVTCCAALEEAYKNLVMQGKYPACVLMLEVPPATVDVNIHPAKAQVRFSDEKVVFNCMYFAVKNAFLASGLIYEFELKEERKTQQYYKQKPFEPEKFEQQELTEVTEKNPVQPPQQTVTAETDPEKKMFDDIIKPVSQSEYAVPQEDNIQSDDENKLASSRVMYNEMINIVVSPEDVEEDEEVSESVETDDFSEFSYISKSSFEKSVEQPPEPVKEVKEEITVIGEIFKNYILAQSGENMVIIDKHAAHERVIFETLRAGCKSTDSQMLMTEPEILLSEKECNALSENMDTLEHMGFRIDTSKSPFAKILAVPLILESLDLEEYIPEIAENFCLNKVDPQTHLLDDILHDLACKSAIKANDKNSLQELQVLAERVFYNEDIRHCPHGRPVMFVLSKRDIEKQFRRIV